LSVVKVLESHQKLQFIHSGDWWTINRKKGRKKSFSNRQVAMVTQHTAGFMSMNVQPASDQFYWITREDDENHLQVCLENANYARDEARSHGLKVPVYCTLQPSNARQAEKWFQAAIDAGHVHLCMGVSEFLKFPKYRVEARDASWK